MKPLLQALTKVLAICMLILPLTGSYVSGKSNSEDGNTFYETSPLPREVNTSHSTIPKTLKSEETTSIFVESVANSGWTPESLVYDEFLGSGSCVNITNITYTGDNRSIGRFSRNPNNPAFPFESGIILSTGKVIDAMGPNNFNNVTTETNEPGDADLDLIASPNPTYDATVLSFDFQPATSSVSFRYIFASDEYPQWACSQFNDVFAFFISGSGITPDPEGFSNGAKNIALLPDGITPVSINNIHVDGWNQYQNNGPNPNCPDVNGEYYVAVPPSATTIEYDGRTVVLTATLDGLSPCDTYKMKLAIADVSDRKLDSAVFLEALSFETGSDIQIKNFDFKNNETNDIFRGCNPNTLRIERTNSDITQEEEITYTVGGTALYNTHHDLTGGTVTIPANETYIDIPYNLIDNPISGGSATIVIETITGCLCDPNPVTISKTINIYETYELESVSPVHLISCNEDATGSINVVVDAFSPQFDFYFTYVLKDESDNIIQSLSTQNSSHTFNNLTEGTYSIEVTDMATCTFLSQDNIIVMEEEVAPPALTLEVSGKLTCDMEEVTLSATSNGEVEWFFGNAAVGTGLEHTVSEPGTYTAVATDDNGCISTETIEVEQDITTPSLSLEVSGLLTCEAEQVTITATSNGEVEWFFENNTIGTGLELMVANPGTYNAVATAENGCSSTETIEVEQQITPPSLSLDVSGELTCDVQQVTLTAISDGEIEWFFENASTGTGLELTVSESGTYTAIASAENGCTTTETIQVEQNTETPSLSLEVSGLLTCEVQQVTLTANSSGDVEWFFDNTSVGTGLELIVTETGTYTAVATAENGCTSTETIDVEQNEDVPDLSLEVSGILTCEVKEVTLTATSNGEVEWFFDNVSVGTGVGLIVSESGVYTAVATSETGCTSSKTIAVKQDTDNPTLSLEVSGVLACEIQEVTLTATSNGEVEWFFDNTSVGTGAELAVSEPGIYTAIATSENGCTNEASITVDQDIDKPTVTHDPISALCIDALPFVLGTPVDNGTYSGIGISEINNSYQFDVLESGIYTITYSETGENGCIGSVEIDITVLALPEVSLAAFETICSGAEAFALTGGLPEGGTYSGEGVDTDGKFSPQLAGSGIHTITYTYTDPLTSCTSEATQTIEVNQSPCVEVVVNNVSCFGENDGSISVSLTCGEIEQVSLLGSNGKKHKAQGTLKADFDNLSPGNYQVIVKDVNGCTVNIPVTITEPEALEISLVSISHVSEYGAGDGYIEIEVSGGTPEYEYLWNIGETTNTVDELTPGTYTVVVTDANYCTAVESFEIEGETDPDKIMVDLGITIEVNIATPDPEEVDELIFALVVTNHDEEEDATGVMVENTIPVEFPFMQRLDDGTSGSFDPATGKWDIGTVEAGSYVILVYKTEMLLEPELKSSSALNSAQIQPFNQIDPYLSNNYAEVVVTIGESTGGDDNGIESNGSMASQLALRNHRRLVESNHIPKSKRLTVMDKYSHTDMLVGNLKSARLDGEIATGISLLLPEKGPASTKAFVSTPADLLRITNAKEIFSVDYLQENNSRRAAILAISTEPSRVYEHTKVICDRLVGAELQEIRMIEIAGKPFILSKLVHPGGYVDYSVSFIAQRTNNGFEIDNRWYNDEYEIYNNDDIFNFQVWSVTPQFTKELVEDILATMEQSGRVSFRNEDIKPGIPQVYVQSGRYTNGGLLLNLVNNAGANSISIYGNKSIVENGDRKPLRLTVDIPTEKYIEVFIPTGYMFDAGFSITNNKDDAPDLLYYADGPWMYDYDPGNATISMFNTVAEESEIIEHTLKVERNASYSGRVRTWASMFRALAPRQAPVDLKGYDMVIFEAYGKGTVEFMIAKESIHQWSDQFRTTLSLYDKPQQYTIRFDDLTNKEGAKGFTAEDVVSVIFNAIGNGSTASNFDVNISNLRFANSQQVIKQNAVFYPAYPNPFADRTYIDLSVTNAGHVKAEVLNLLGQTVEVLLDEFVSTGDYKLNWNPVSNKTGVYMLRISVGDEIYTSKLIYKN